MFIEHLLWALDLITKIWFLQNLIGQYFHITFDVSYSNI